MEPVDKEEIKRNVFQFIREQRVGVIATVAPDNTPEAANVMYFLDEDNSIYLLAHKDSRKITNIQANNHIAFVIGTSLLAHTAQIQGTADILEETSESFQTISQKFMTSNMLSLDPIFSQFKNNYVIIKMTIAWLRWLTFEQNTNKENYIVLIP